MEWVSQHRRLAGFAVLVLLQVLLVVGIIVREEQFQRGTEIVLESRPVDPFDPLRGDYVILGYVADDLEGVPGVRPPSGSWVYVVFEDRGRFWEPVEVLSDRPDREWTGTLIAIRARVLSASPLQVDYPNLDQYFVPQGTGNLPEPPDVHVSVSADGTARIKYLEIEGERWPSKE